MRTHKVRATIFGFLTALLAAACSAHAGVSAPTEVVVEGLDYAFALPDSLAPGPSILRFRNGGKVPHELAVALLKSGTSVADLMSHVAKGGSPDDLIDGVVGILIAQPGATAAGGLAVELLPGRTYALACNFQDEPGKPEHVMLGMFSGRVIGSAP